MRTRSLYRGLRLRPEPVSLGLSYTAGMRELLINAGLAAMVALILLYLVYVAGLARVFARLGLARWKALVPGYNYYVLIVTLRLPKRWFAQSLIPYAGAVYAFAVANRLGRVFNRTWKFSSVWLTYGGVVGMHVIARDPRPPDRSVLDERPRLSFKRSGKAGR